jgi:hypothetical protein
MSAIRRTLGLVAVLAMYGTGAMAQPAPYRAQADTLYYSLLTKRVVTFIRGRDTLRIPTVQFAVMSERWSQVDSHLRVVTHTICINFPRRSVEDTVDVSPHGQILMINGRVPDANAAQQRDFLLHLPDEKLKPGTVWLDSTIVSKPGAGGGIVRSMRLSLRVNRVDDAAGNTRVADIIAEGALRDREGYWIDSAAGRSGWIDVAGPSHQEFRYDVKYGELYGHYADATLPGWGTLPNRTGGDDTLPVVLSLHVIKRSLSAERAQMLARPLPGQDTSITMDSTQNVIYLQTTKRAGDTIEAGMARPAGWMRTASSRFANGRPLIYDATWTDTTYAWYATRHVERRGDSLWVHTERSDTTIGVPAVTWAVADETMNEFLVPALLTLPHDSTEHPIAVYRPWTRRWDVWTARVWEVGGMYAAWLTQSKQDPPQFLILTKDGDLLLSEERRGKALWIRTPRVGGSRAIALQEVLKKLHRPVPPTIGTAEALPGVRDVDVAVAQDAAVGR